MLAAVLLTLVLSVATSSAGPDDKLRDTQKRLRRLDRDLGRHTRRARSLKDRIDALNRAITDVQITVNALDADIARVRSTVRSSQAKLERLRDEIDDIKDVAREQAVLLYKAGRADTLDALLDSKSLIEFNDRIEMLGVAAQKNTGALVRYGRLGLVIEVENRRLFSRQEELAAARRAQARVLKERNALRARLALELRRLRSRIGHERTREGHLERAAEQLRAKIIAAQARYSAEALGTSAQGFIWPLNGPVTSPFGPRWGSTHTGIDIDGYTGQPVVASKAGTIIYAGAGMSGYGNAVVIDHGGGISTLYAHLSAYEATSGAAGQGDVIGYVGCTGNCYGDHLHFEVLAGGNPVDPLGYLP